MAGVDPARDFSTDTAPAWTPQPAYWPVNPFDDTGAGIAACKAMDLDLGLSNVTNSAWGQQMQNLAACVNVQGNYTGVPELVRYAVDPARTVKNNESLAAFTVGLASQFFDTNGQPGGEPARKESYREFGNLLVDPSNRADLIQAQSFLPFLFKNQYCTVYPEWTTHSDYCPPQTERVSVVQGLLRSLSLVTTQGEQLQGLTDVLSTVVSDPVSGEALALLYDTFTKADAQGTASPAQIPNPTVRPVLAIQSNPSVTKDMVYDYWNLTRNNDRVYSYQSAQDFKNQIQPMLDYAASSPYKIPEWFMTIAETEIKPLRP